MIRYDTLCWCFCSGTWFFVSFVGFGIGLDGKFDWNNIDMLYKVERPGRRGGIAAFEFTGDSLVQVIVNLVFVSGLKFQMDKMAG